MNNYLSAVKRFLPRASDGSVHPLRDWFVMLSVGGLLLLISVVWNAWIFIELENGKTLGKAATPTTIVSHQTIANVQGIFQDRAATRVHYQTDYHFVDPSK